MAKSLKTTADDRVWRRLREKVRGIDKRFVKVGVIGSGAGQAYDDGPTVAEVAAFHEFGSKDGQHPPERSFIRRTFFEKRAQHVALLHRLTRLILADKLDAERALGLLGSWAVDAIKATIRARIPPPLKPETIKRKTTKAGKKGDIPLIDTGRLLGAISWALSNKGDGQR